jgi:hypothetical protein
MTTPALPPISWGAVFELVSVEFLSGVYIFIRKMFIIHALKIYLRM